MREVEVRFRHPGQQTDRNHHNTSNVITVIEVDATFEKQVQIYVKPQMDTVPTHGFTALRAWKTLMPKPFTTKLGCRDHIAPWIMPD